MAGISVALSTRTCKAAADRDDRKGRWKGPVGSPGSIPHAGLFPACCCKCLDQRSPNCGVCPGPAPASHLALAPAWVPFPLSPQSKPLSWPWLQGGLDRGRGGTTLRRARYSVQAMVLPPRSVGDYSSVCLFDLSDINPVFPVLPLNHTKPFPSPCNT